MLHLMALLIALFGGGPVSADISGSGPPSAPVISGDVSGADLS